MRSVGEDMIMFEEQQVIMLPVGEHGVL